MINNSKNLVIPITFQIWLETNFPSLEERQNVRKLCIFPESYLNDKQHWETYKNDPDAFHISDWLSFNKPWMLDFSEFISLEELTIEGQKLISLRLSSTKLKKLCLPNNLLRSIIWPSSSSSFQPLELKELREINLVNNNLPERDLSIFSRFPNLTSLLIGTDDRKRIEQGVCNGWKGSLEKIENLVHLRDLDINATNVFGGLECLPTDKLVRFTFGTMGREGAEVKRLQNKCERFLDPVFNEGETMDDWAQNSAKSEEIINLIRQWQNELKEKWHNQTQVEVWKC